MLFIEFCKKQGWITEWKIGFFRDYAVFFVVLLFYKANNWVFQIQKENLWKEKRNSVKRGSFTDEIGGKAVEIVAVRLIGNL